MLKLPFFAPQVSCAFTPFSPQARSRVGVKGFVGRGTKKNHSGFTLVEVIIAFALLAMLAGMMFAGFRFATQATDKGNNRNEMNEDMRRSQDF